MVVRRQDFTLLTALKAHSELASVADITRIILTKDMTSVWYERPDLFVLFEEINNIMQCITHAFTLSETVIGLCQYRFRRTCSQFAYMV